MWFELQTFRECCFRYSPSEHSSFACAPVSVSRTSPVRDLNGKFVPSSVDSTQWNRLKARASTILFRRTGSVQVSRWSLPLSSLRFQAASSFSWPTFSHPHTSSYIVMLLTHRTLAIHKCSSIVLLQSDCNDPDTAQWPLSGSLRGSDTRKC